MMVRVSVVFPEYYTDGVDLEDYRYPLRFVKKLEDKIGLKFHWSRVVIGQLLRIQLEEESVRTFPVPDAGSYLKWLYEQFDRELIVTYNKGILNILINNGEHSVSNDKM